MGTLHLNTLKDLGVRHFVLPFDAEEASEASHVESIEFLCMSVVGSPRLTFIQ